MARRNIYMLQHQNSTIHTQFGGEVKLSIIKFLVQFIDFFKYFFFHIPKVILSLYCFLFVFVVYNLHTTQMIILYILINTHGYLKVFSLSNKFH